MGNGFKKVKASFVGSHKNSDKIPQWLKANGGEYSRDIDDSVTHLIATESVIEDSVAVEKARSLKIKIVTYDWLEDSLTSKPYRPKREGPYLWDRILKEREDKYKVAKDGQKMRRGVDIEKVIGEFQKEAQAVTSDMEKLGYHLYVDESTGATFSATLVRHTLIKNRSRKEKFLARVSGPDNFIAQRPLNPHLLRVPVYNPFAQRIQVYETNKEPHTYTTFVKYTRVGISSKDMLAPRGSTLDIALFAFKKFFRVKTGVEWKDRFDDSKLLLSPKAGEDGEAIQPPEGGWFRYERPSGLMGALNKDAEMAIDEEITGGNASKEKEPEGKEPEGKEPEGNKGSETVQVVI